MLTHPSYCILQPLFHLSLNASKHASLHQKNNHPQRSLPPVNRKYVCEVSMNLSLTTPFPLLVE